MAEGFSQRLRGAAKGLAATRRAYEGFDEQAFREWYAERASTHGLDPNPDSPEHFYDYRAAFSAGAEPDERGKWPSQFKEPGHPERFVAGVDTSPVQLPASAEIPAFRSAAETLYKRKAKPGAPGLPDLPEMEEKEPMFEPFDLEKELAKLRVFKTTKVKEPTPTVIGLLGKQSWKMKETERREVVKYVGELVEDEIKNAPVIARYTEEPIAIQMRREASRAGKPYEPTEEDIRKEEVKRLNADLEGQGVNLSVKWLETVWDKMKVIHDSHTLERFQGYQEDPTRLEVEARMLPAFKRDEVEALLLSGRNEQAAWETARSLSKFSTLSMFFLGEPQFLAEEEIISEHMPHIQSDSKRLLTALGMEIGVGFTAPIGYIIPFLGKIGGPFGRALTARIPKTPDIPGLSRAVQAGIRLAQRPAGEVLTTRIPGTPDIPYRRAARAVGRGAERVYARTLEPILEPLPGSARPMRYVKPGEQEPSRAQLTLEHPYLERLRAPTRMARQRAALLDEPPPPKILPQDAYAGPKMDRYLQQQLQRRLRVKEQRYKISGPQNKAAQHKKLQELTTEELADYINQGLYDRQRHFSKFIMPVSILRDPARLAAGVNYRIGVPNALMKSREVVKGLIGDLSREHPSYAPTSKEYILELADQIKKEGLKRQVFINVLDDGKIEVLDGTHRLAALDYLEIPDVRVEVATETIGRPKQLEQLRRIMLEHYQQNPPGATREVPFTGEPIAAAAPVSRRAPQRPETMTRAVGPLTKEFQRWLGRNWEKLDRAQAIKGLNRLLTREAEMGERIFKPGELAMFQRRIEKLPTERQVSSSRDVLRRARADLERGVKEEEELFAPLEKAYKQAVNRKGAAVKREYKRLAKEYGEDNDLFNYLINERNKIYVQVDNKGRVPEEFRFLPKHFLVTKRYWGKNGIFAKSWDEFVDDLLTDPVTGDRTPSPEDTTQVFKRAIEGVVEDQRRLWNEASENILARDPLADADELAQIVRQDPSILEYYQGLANQGDEWAQFFIRRFENQELDAQLQTGRVLLKPEEFRLPPAAKDFPPDLPGGVRQLFDTNDQSAWQMERFNVIKDIYNLTDGQINRISRKVAGKRLQDLNRDEAVKVLQSITSRARPSQIEEIQKLAKKKRISTRNVAYLARQFYSKKLDELTQDEASSLLINVIEPLEFGARISRTGRVGFPAVTDRGLRDKIRNMFAFGLFATPDYFFRKVAMPDWLRKALVRAPSDWKRETWRILQQTRRLMMEWEDQVGKMSPWEVMKRSPQSFRRELAWRYKMSKFRIMGGDLPIRPAETAREISARRITDFIEGNIPEADMLPIEIKVANFMKALWKGRYLPEINRQRKLRGLEEVPEGFKYVSHILNRTYRTMKKLTGEWDMPPEVEAAVRISTPGYNISKHALERVSEQAPLERNIWKIMRAYVPALEKSMVLNKVLPAYKNWRTQWGRKHISATVADWLDDTISHQLMGRPSRVDEVFARNFLNKILSVAGKKKVRIPMRDGTFEEMVVPRFSISERGLTKAASMWRRWNYYHVFAANVAQFFLNLTQPLLGFAQLRGGPWRTSVDSMYGMGRAFTDIFSKKKWDMYRRLGILTDFEEGVMYGFENMTGMEELASRFSMAVMRTGEFLNRVAVSQAKKKNVMRFDKKTEREALNLGKELSEMVNFLYGEMNTPEWVYKMGGFGKLAYQFSSFAIKYAEQLAYLGAKLKIPVKEYQAAYQAAARAEARAARRLARGEISQEYYNVLQRNAADAKFLKSLKAEERRQLFSYIGAMGTMMAAYYYGLNLNMIESVVTGPLPSVAWAPFTQGMYHLFQGDFEQASRNLSVNPLTRPVRIAGQVRDIARGPVKRDKEGRGLYRIKGARGTQYYTTLGGAIRAIIFGGRAVEKKRYYKGMRRGAQEREKEQEERHKAFMMKYEGRHKEATEYLRKRGYRPMDNREFNQRRRSYEMEGFERLLRSVPKRIRRRVGEHRPNI